MKLSNVGEHDIKMKEQASIWTFWHVSIVTYIYISATTCELPHKRWTLSLIY